MAPRTAHAAAAIFKHGYSAYTAGKCKCTVCRAAKAERQRQLRARHRRSLLLVDRHGKGRHVVSGIKHGYSGYQEFACRCMVCAVARSEYDAMRMAPVDARFDPCPDCGVRKRVTAAGELWGHRRFGMKGQCPGSGALVTPLRSTNSRRN